MARAEAMAAASLSAHEGGGLVSWQDDILVDILGRVARAASSPKELLTLSCVSQQMRAALSRPEVLICSSTAALLPRVSQWGPGARTHLQRCMEAGSVEAFFILGTIEFYCERAHERGMALLTCAAAGGHGGAMFALAVVCFHGSGGARADRSPGWGAELCYRAALLGHREALQELGYCFMDGYGVPASAFTGQCLLQRSIPVARSSPLPRCQAADALRSVGASLQDSGAERSSFKRARSPERESESAEPLRLHDFAKKAKRDSNAPSDGGSNSSPQSPPPAATSFGLYNSWREGLVLVKAGDANAPPTCEDTWHPVHGFLREWAERQAAPRGLQVCGRRGCWRPESRAAEFRCCSLCRRAKYCSRVCQAADWHARHRLACSAYLGLWTCTDCVAAPGVT